MLGIFLGRKISVNIALYDLQNDEKELTNVAEAHPDIVATLQSKADSIRLVLGDKVKGIVGKEVRK